MKFSRKFNLLAAIVLLVLGVCLAQATAAEKGVPCPPEGMAFIPGGMHLPLFRTENDPKEVPVAPFFLDRFPVTHADFLKFVQANPKWRKSNVKRLFADAEYLKLWASDLELGTHVHPQAPVTHVSWFAAKAFADWKGKRLPTVAEWEFVARASASRLDGENDPQFKRQINAWYASPAPEKTPAVGKNEPNLFGVYDLHGLVWEWVADFNTAMVTGDARGDNGLDRQLFCGSGAAGAKDRGDFPAFMRYGFRSSLKANYTVHNLGFRCAQEIHPAPES